MVTRQQKEIAELVKLTELAFQRDAAPLQPLLAEQARIQSQLAQLEAAVRDARPGDTPAHMSGSVAAYQIWAQGKRSSLNMELARNRAQSEYYKDRLKKSFGRKLAAQHLDDMLRKKLAVERNRPKE